MASGAIGDIFPILRLFVFSMTMLVSVSNFVLLYVFWEAVGLCSYLLIGFWYEKPSAAAAGKKAFLVNRIGDFGFASGYFLDMVGLWHARFSRYGQYGHWGDYKCGRIGTDAFDYAGIIYGRIDWHGDLFAVIAGRLREERAVSLARVAAGRDGRSVAGERVDPCRNDGYGRGVYAGQMHAVVFGFADRFGGGDDNRRCDRAVGGDYRYHSNRFEADSCLFHD